MLDRDAYLSRFFVVYCWIKEHLLTTLLFHIHPQWYKISSSLFCKYINRWWRFCLTATGSLEVHFTLILKQLTTFKLSIRFIEQFWKHTVNNVFLDNQLLFYAVKVFRFKLNRKVWWVLRSGQQSFTSPSISCPPNASFSQFLNKSFICRIRVFISVLFWPNSAFTICVLGKISGRWTWGHAEC